MRRKYTGEPTSSEPMFAARSRNCLPEASRVTMGGTSRPVNSLALSSEVPASAPMYAPESSVLKPEMPEVSSRGRTTQ